MGEVGVEVVLVDGKGKSALGKRSMSFDLGTDRTCVFDEDRDLETCSGVSSCWRI